MGLAGNPSSAFRFAAMTVIGLALVAAGCPGSRSSSAPASFEELVNSADRILIAKPAETARLNPTRALRAAIVRSLHGGGQKGNSIKITAPSPAPAHEYQADTEYLFLLTKGTDGSWVSQSPEPLALRDGSIVSLATDPPQERLSLDKLQQLLADATAAAASQVVDTPGRSKLAGRWYLILPQQGLDFAPWLIEISADDGKLSAQLLESAEQMQGTRLTTRKLTSEGIELVFASPKSAFEFTGTHQDGKVYGALAVRGKLVTPAFLEPTEAKDLSDKVDPTPSLGATAFERAQQLDQPHLALWKFAESSPRSPLALEALANILRDLPSSKLKDADLKSVIKLYEQLAATWGPQILARARVITATTLARHNRLPDEIDSRLEAADQALSPTSPAELVTSLRSRRALRAIAAGNLDEGLQTLQALHTEYPADVEQTFYLARALRDAGRPAEALPLFAELVALPQTESLLVETLKFEGEDMPRAQWPSRVLADLWKADHPDTSGLDEYLDTVYLQGIARIRDQAIASAPPQPATGTQAVLVELFTGAACPPCAAGDITTEVLEAAFPNAPVHVLRWHMHIPGPDPLANDAGERRFRAYSLQGTPTGLINGRPAPSLGGYLFQVNELYADLAQALQPILAKTAPATVELTARLDGQQLEVSATATDIRQSLAPLRLRAVLAEDDLTYRAGNGIRHHNHVARAMLGGDTGVGPKDGKLQLSAQIDLGELRSEIAANLQQFERQNELRFDARPLDFKSFTVFAWVQNEQTGEVLQSAMVKVDGTLTLAPLPASQKPE